MARIKTRSDLKKFLLRQMGSPSINVEVTNEQLDDAIDQAIQYYSEFAYGGTIDGTLLVQLEKGQRTYKLDDSIIAIRNVFAQSAVQPFINIPEGYALAVNNPMSLNFLTGTQGFDVSAIVSRFAQIENIKELFTVKPKWDFNFNTKVFTLYEDVSQDKILLEISMEYRAPDDGETPDAIFDNFWIKKRALAHAYYMWANVVGKYDTSLVNGSRINYSEIRAQGDTLMQETNETLNDIMDPLGPLVF